MDSISQASANFDDLYCRSTAWEYYDSLLKSV